ncbi:hypothetical protein T4B_11150 [Trichinella pseudospiralis]|uniref:Uncharacterized protein n=1 Tax=Trichinella pseudospiralis TaxID=6337 RepID=A0A0V1I337_TRIPS|nr:hypothetical protein T4A_13979 [Trichinella pseudospiralis]KRZ17233.1 hypothetical protein T4B_11150 [Trichinella pseudospiralis]KRZ26657.1 hypothetical protein T4C_10478 [Trichinella pseudospiralis]
MADIPELRTCRQKEILEMLKKQKMLRWCHMDKPQCNNGDQAEWSRCPVDEHLAYKMEKKAILNKRSAEETKPILAIYDEASSLRFCYIMYIPKRQSLVCHPLLSKMFK